MPTPREKLMAMYNQPQEYYGPVLQGDPGSAPSQLAGLVMNPRNAQLIAKTMNTLGQSNVFTYMAAKYPKIYNLVYKTALIGKDLAHEGSYLPGTKEVRILAPEATSPRTAEVLGHELIHGVRDRAGRLRDILNFNGPIDLEESLARKGGATAKKTYEKFLELMK